MDAEQIYLFRHALVRDAAYELHLPGERRQLHGIAFDVLERVAGGRPTGPHPLHVPGRARETHPSDSFAHELATHARLAEDRAEQQLLYLQRAAEHAERHYESAEAIQLWLQAADLAAPAAGAEATKRAAVLCARTGRPQQAQTLFNRARGIAVACGARGLEGEIAAWIAQMYDYTGRPAEAEKGYAEALAILREANADAEVSTLGNLACLYWKSGRHEEAERTFYEVLTRARKSGDLLQEGKSLSNLAGLYRDTGRRELAEETVAASLKLAQQLGDRFSESLRLGNLASLQARNGKLRESEQHYRQACQILTEIGDRRGLAVGLGELAGIHLRLGEVDVALQEARQAVELSSQVQARLPEALNLHCVAQCLLSKGDVLPAKEAWRRSADLLMQLGENRQLERCKTEIAVACGSAGVPPFDEIP